jgi:hypothetical protein
MCTTGHLQTNTITLYEFMIRRPEFKCAPAQSMETVASTAAQLGGTHLAVVGTTGITRFTLLE